MSTGEQLDWFNRLRLRIQLLPDNPYFQDTVVEVRHELGIPVCGLRNREGLGQWMYDHLKAHAPNFLPQEPSASGLSSEATKNARRITLENLQKRAERWFKESMPDRLQRQQLMALPIMERSTELIEAFGLPSTLLNRLVWLVLTGESILDKAFATWRIDNVGERSNGPMSVDPIDRAIYEDHWSELPEDVPGAQASATAATDDAR